MTEDINDIRKKIIKEALRIEEDSLYSYKINYKMGLYWRNVNLSLGIIATFFAALAGASILYELRDYTILIGILALIVSALTGVITFLSPQQKANWHKLAGDKYNSLNNDTRIFREIDCLQINTKEELIMRIRELNDRRTEINMSNPHFSQRAYEKAKKGIIKGEATYKVDNK